MKNLHFQRSAKNHSHHTRTNTYNRANIRKHFSEHTVGKRMLFIHINTVQTDNAFCALKRTSSSYVRFNERNTLSDCIVFIWINKHPFPHCVFTQVFPEVCMVISIGPSVMTIALCGSPKVKLLNPLHRTMILKLCIWQKLDTQLVGKKGEKWERGAGH